MWILRHLPPTTAKKFNSHAEEVEKQRLRCSAFKPRRVKKTKDDMKQANAKEFNGRDFGFRCPQQQATRKRMGAHVEELIVHRVLIVPVRLRSELRVQQVLVGRVIDEA